ncbi:STAS domain-containing protein [Streptomyces sp. NPDC004330]|uniref:STAS domain-containing protein n=1 Tax=Streptomyces sp. NPDC004330 TaxID=3364700 RepID=UPI00369C5C9E
MELHRTSATPAEHNAVQTPEAPAPGLSVQLLAGPPGTRVLVLTGEADSDTAPVLARALDAALDEPPAPEVLVVDCSGLQFCACAGLNEFLRARLSAVRAEIRLALAALTPQVARLLDLTGTDTVFEILPEAPPVAAPKPPVAAPVRPSLPIPPQATAPTGTGMGAQAAALSAQAERQTSADQWDLSAAGAALARTTATQLGETVGPAHVQEALPGIERLERLREALAVLTIGTAHTHGQLAWFLSSATVALTPVLRWRALVAEDRQAFGTVVPTQEEFTDAENAVRHLRTALTHITARDQERDPVLPEAAARDLQRPGEREGRAGRRSPARGERPPLGGM